MDNPLPTEAELSLMPCPHRHKIINGLMEPIGADLSYEPVTIVSCKLLDAALGWWHGSSSDLCRRCWDHRKETGAPPSEPRYGADDPVSREFSDMLLRQLRVRIPDEVLKQVIGMDRDALIQRAKSVGVPHDEIVMAIFESAQLKGFDRQAAYDIADRNGLLTDE